jgi:hypothetical protein
MHRAELIAALSLGAAVLGFVILLILHDRRIKVGEEARRQRDRIAIAREEQNRATRRQARERARIAYPELYDAGEADTLPPLDPVPDYDEERIRKALKLLEEEIARAETDCDPDFDEEYEVLCSFLNAKWKTLERRDPSAYLNEPARFIDCGDAGRIELFTAAQVEAARECSGFTVYVIVRKRRAKAPEVAELVIARAKAHAELVEREKREAEAAITTKASDLPPLPNED